MWIKEQTIHLGMIYTCLYMFILVILPIYDAIGGALLFHPHYDVAHSGKTMVLHGKNPISCLQEQTSTRFIVVFHQYVHFTSKAFKGHFAHQYGYFEDFKDHWMSSADQRCMIHPHLYWRSQILSIGGKNSFETFFWQVDKITQQ